MHTDVIHTEDRSCQVTDPSDPFAIARESLARAGRTEVRTFRLLVALLISGGVALAGPAAEAKTEAPAAPQECVIKALPDKRTGSAVRAGDLVTLALSAPLPAAGKLRVKVEDAEALARSIGPCEVSFRTPEGLKKGDHPVTLFLGDKPLADAVITVYPSTLPTVTRLYPQDVKPGRLITVTGTGLAGPKDRVRLRVGPVVADTLQVDPDGTWFVATFDKKKYEKICTQRDKNVEVSAWDVVATPPDDHPPVLNLPSSWQEVLTVSLLALLTVAVVIAVLYLLFMIKSRARRKVKELADRMAIASGIAVLPEDEDQPRGFLKSLVYEPQNNTLSLSRAQLVWWLFLIGYGYIFLFIAQHFVRGRWELLPLGNFGYTFLISLGTLVTSQVATGLRGAKGAGAVRPGWGDLVTNGGVLALERVQQVFWTVIIGGVFIVTIIGTYNTATEVPSIPTELLVLMGLSSGAYVVGKSIARPGPIISQVLAEIGSIKVKIYGINMSMGPTATDGKTTMPQDAGVRILIDNVVQPVDRIRTVEPDVKQPNQFAKVLEVEIPEQVEPKPDAWLEKSHTVRIINADGQSADWEGVITLAKVDGAGGAKAEGGRPEQQLGAGPAASAEAEKAKRLPEGDKEKAEEALAHQRQPTQDTENRIPAGPGDPGGGATAPEAEESSKTDREKN